MAHLHACFSRTRQPHATRGVCSTTPAWQFCPRFCLQVEMAVPYADPNEPFTRKCAFDVGGKSLLSPSHSGACSSSLRLSEAPHALLRNEVCWALACTVGCASLGLGTWRGRASQPSAASSQLSSPLAADYGLGNCANSLELGCDCLGNIQYFDALLNDSKGG